MGNSTMSIYTHCSRGSPFQSLWNSWSGTSLGLSSVGSAGVTVGEEKEPVMKVLVSSCAVALGLAMGLSACTDPYDPGQRAIGGGLFGAATGAAIGGIAGGGRGAATGALIGGGLGAVGGAATTPGYYGYGYNGYGSNGYGSNGYGSNAPGYYGSGYYGPGYGFSYDGSGYNRAGYYGYSN